LHSRETVSGKTLDIEKELELAKGRRKPETVLGEDPQYNVDH